MIDRQALFDNLNSGILEERYRVFRHNIVKNRSRIREHGGLAGIVSRFEGKHVVVIGAGPSLDDAVALLARFRNNPDIVYIAADMALAPLCRRGVLPHYAISCETTPLDFFGGFGSDTMHLLAFSAMSPVNLRRWRGGISFYNWMLRGEPYEELWNLAGNDLGFLATASIVTTQAIAFALGCRIRSLALVGNDLGFRHRFYARATVPHGMTIRTADRCAPVESQAKLQTRLRREYHLLRGERGYFTNSQFLAAKLWLEDLFKTPRVPVYDCSDPGCSENTVIKSTLEGFFALHAGVERSK